MCLLREDMAAEKMNKKGAWERNNEVKEDSNNY